MTVFVVLFRGVGGTTQLPVKRLRAALEEAGFANVATYINSGNAVVKTAMSREAARAAITDLCSREFGFEKDIHLRTTAEWEALIDRNPFPDALAVPNLLHAAVLAEAPGEERVEALRAYATAGERIAVVDAVAYIHTPNGFGRSKLAERFDREIGVANTARNWNTVLKLAELARAAA